MRFPLAALLVTILLPASGRTQAPGSIDALGSEMLAWFDTLGMPDVSGKPYVRVDTGRWFTWSGQSGAPRQYQSVEGFLLDEDEDSFTVFISGVREFRSPDGANYVSPLGESDTRFAPLRTARFEREFEYADETSHASYQVFDLDLHAAELIERVRQQTLVKEERINDLFSPLGNPAPGAQVVAFAHALRQAGREPQGDELLQVFIRACLAEGRDGWWQNPLARLQETLGWSYVDWAETDIVDGIVPRARLIDIHARFRSLFPPGDTGINQARDYMQRSVAILERMAAEEAAHVARPLASLTPAEQATELIYQLRDLQLVVSYRLVGPVGTPRYPFHPFEPKDDSEKTPVHRLIDLGDAAVPALIEALGDESFTRTAHGSIHSYPTRAMRVNEFALSILEYVAGERFPREYDPEGHAIARLRPDVEEWWAERQGGDD